MLNRMARMTLCMLVLAMVVVSSACSNGTKTGAEPNNPGEASAGGKNAAADASKANASQQVNIKIMGQFASSNLSETDKALVESVEKATNTKIEFEIPPSTGYAERQQLMLTTGEYPDVVYFSDPRNKLFLSAVSDGVIIPLNDYLKSAGNINKYSYDISWDALQVKSDGGIYGIPRTSVIRSDGYFLRKDWLDKVGVKLPDDHEITLDQFVDILTKFTKNDPDGNQKNDTAGFGAYASGDKTMDPFFDDEMGLYGWQETTGGKYKYMDLQYDLNSDQYTKLLEFNSKLYKEGLLDPDAPLIDAATAQSRFESGRSGVLRGFAGNYQMILDNGRKINPKFDLDYVFVKNQQGELKGLGQGTGLYGFWAVTNKAKDPQRIVDVFDYMLSDKGWDTIYYGIEGKDYATVDGKKVYSDKKYDTFIRKNLVRRANDYMFFIDPSASEDLKQRLVPLIKKAVDRLVLSKDRNYTPDIARTPAYLDFSKKFSEVKSRIIVGDAKADEYKKTLQQWQTQFGDTYFKQMNDYIEKMSSKK